MTLNAEKCKFKETELIYLGHKLTVNVIELDENKIKSILEMPNPEDASRSKQIRYWRCSAPG